MDWKAKYYQVIFYVYAFFMRMASRGRLEYALDRVYTNSAHAVKLCERSVRRIVDKVRYRDSDAAVAAVVKELHETKKRQV